MELPRIDELVVVRKVCSQDEAKAVLTRMGFDSPADFDEHVEEMQDCYLDTFYFDGIEREAVLSGELVLKEKAVPIVSVVDNRFYYEFSDLYGDSNDTSIEFMDENAFH